MTKLAVTNEFTELSKEHSKAIQGIAVLFMLALHLFCRRENLPHHVKLYVNNIPLLYYIGLWGDQCVALFCFCAGYASYLQQEERKKQDYINYSGKRVFKLLINYWIVILVSILIGILAGKEKVIPGTLIKLLGNVFLFNISYNGAWWFMLTYIILMICSPILYIVVKRYKGSTVFSLFGIMYFISYLVRFNSIKFPDMGVMINWIIKQCALFGTSVLPYIWGMLFYKYKIISSLRNKMGKLSKCDKIVFSMMLFAICIITHGIVQSLIIAPIYAIVTVCVISLWEGKMIKILKYMGDNSTNIWLVHMFFYMDIFPDFIFIFKYPILIYIMMLALCLIVSSGIRWIYSKSIKNCKYLKLNL